MVLKTKSVTVNTPPDEGHTEKHDAAEDGAPKITYTISKHGVDKNEKATIGSKRTLKLGSCAHVLSENAFKAPGGSGIVTTLIN